MNFEFDGRSYLKIDGYLIKHILEDPIKVATVEAINPIGHLMGLQTIAEFVENEAILAKVQGLGIDYAQGWKQLAISCRKL